MRAKLQEKGGSSKPAGGQTFLSFFILEGGHLPFFLSRLFRTRRFLRSLIFLASFILSFCSIFSFSFDSNGRFSTGMAASPDPCEGGKGSGLLSSFPSSSEEARTITDLFPAKVWVGLGILIPWKDPFCKVRLLCGIFEAEIKNRNYKSR